jgi:hypothetical protein
MSENRSIAQPPGAAIFPAAEVKRQMAERGAAKTADGLRQKGEVRIR